MQEHGERSCASTDIVFGLKDVFLLTTEPLVMAKAMNNCGTEFWQAYEPVLRLSENRRISSLRASNGTRGRYRTEGTLPS